MKFDLQLSREELEAQLAFEAEWDPLLGGRGSRAYREIAMYAIGRLMGIGAELEDVLVYLQTLGTQLKPLLPKSGEEKSSS